MGKLFLELLIVNLQVQGNDCLFVITVVTQLLSKTNF